MVCFKNIRGHAAQIQILKQDIRQGRLAQSWLFSGPEGIGKKLTAVALAKALNCQAQADDACGECPSCLKIEKLQHPDFFLLDASGIGEAEPSDSEAIKIESVRDLGKNISLRPYEAKYKVFIIDEAHNLTAEAANALLKTLEEPPKNSLLVLVSSKPALLFKTILSRCNVLKFYALPRKELEDVLRNEYSLHVNLAHFLAYFCEGRIGAALRERERDILREKNAVIDAFFLAKNFKQPLTAEKRQDLRRQMHILAGWLRDIYLAKTGVDPAGMINFDRRQDLAKLSQRLTFAELEDGFGLIVNALSYLEANINTKLLVSHLRAGLWKN
jgi:DNA polymerase-3 subunit delta'